MGGGAQNISLWNSCHHRTIQEKKQYEGAISICGIAVKSKSTKGKKQKSGRADY